MGDFVDMPQLSPPVRDALRATLRGQPAAWPELSADDAWALELHGLVPLLYAKTELAPFRDTAIRAAAAEPLRLADLREVLAALAAVGVEPLILKGTALAYQLYDAPEHRPRGDTDLLIRTDDLDAVRRALMPMGFTERRTSGDDLAFRQATLSRFDAYGVEHLYDVHWAITNTAVFARTLSYEELFARAVSLPELGANARVLSRPDALLHACVHRVAHHHDSERLIWLCDIHLLRDAMSRDEHGRFWRLAAERRLVGVATRAIELTDEWFGGAAHDRAEDWLTTEECTRDERSREYLDRKRSRAAVLRAELSALPSWRMRLHRLRQLALPPRAYMRERFPRSPAPLLPLLYGYRAVRGVVRLFRSVSRDR